MVKLIAIIEHIKNVSDNDIGLVPRKKQTILFNLFLMVSIYKHSNFFKL